MKKLYEAFDFNEVDDDRDEGREMIQHTIWAKSIPSVISSYFKKTFNITLNKELLKHSEKSTNDITVFLGLTSNIARAVAKAGWKQYKYVHNNKKKIIRKVEMIYLV